MRGVARSAAVAALCGLMAGQPVTAMAAVSRIPAATASENQIQGRDRVVHALDRLTFGPRPGEVEAVEREGLQRWFARQLNPGSIDDSALEAREDQYPAMRMSLEELMVRFPSPQMLKQIENGKRPMPTDAVQAAMVRDELAFYEAAQAKKAEKKGDSGVGPTHRDEAAMNGAQGGGNGAQGGGSGAQGGGSGMNGRPEVLEMRGQAALDAAEDGGMAGGQKPLAASEVSAAEPGMDGVAGQPVFPRAETERVLGLAPAERMRAILGMQPMEVVRFRQSLKPAEAQAMLAGLTPAQRETLVALPGGVRMVALEAMESRLERDIYSQRELEAVMTDFWLNHFNVYVRKNQQEPYLLPAYERETIRPHALGRFEDLLVATAESPAMLVYLDNFRSIGPESQAAERVKMAQARNSNGPAAKQASAGLNENYGRELMELHTLGVNGGYTQADVTNVAKVFTGWTIVGPNQQQRGLFSRAKVGEFEFDERRHEPGAKTVLGVTIGYRSGESGEKEGLEVLHMLASSPATAHFISEKLAVRFVSDTPPATLVDRMAASYVKSGGEIKAVLRTMFNSPEFWAKDVYRAKVKTPEEFVVSAVRASGAEVETPQALVQSLDKLGMPLYGMQTPNGYSWTKDAWVGTGQLVSRMNFALVLAGGRMPGVRTEWGPLLGEGQAGVQPAAYDATAGLESRERRLEGVLLDDPVSERTRATVLGQAGDAGVTSQAETQFDLRGDGKKKGDYAARGLGRVRMAGPVDDPQAAVMAGLLLGSPEFQRR